MKRFLLIIYITLSANIAFGCTADFLYYQAPSGNTLLRYGFNNSSSYGSITGHKVSSTIYYGDGSSDTISRTGSTNHTYSSTGVYHVKLTILIYDSLTTIVCTDSLTDTVTVAYPPCGTIISDTIKASGQVHFASSNPAGTSSLRRYWSFGDGGHDTARNPIHTYAANGIYGVSLIDSTPSGSCIYMNVLAVVINNVFYCNSAHPDFTSSGSFYSRSFTNTSTDTFHVCTRTHSWNFGDGGTDTAKSPNHTYTSAGTYNVKLMENYADSATGVIECRDTIIHAVTIIAPNIISGNIIKDTTIGPSPAYYKVWLIVYDTLAHTISAVDSAVDTGMASTNYSFNSVPSGSYLVKAAITNAGTSGVGFVPTYFTTSTSWSTASYINYTSGISSGNNITMQHGTITSGAGFISGDVRYGAGKETGTPGAPVQGLLMMVKDSANDMLAYTYTDAGGVYTFANLPLGIYTVYPEKVAYNIVAYGGIVLSSIDPGAYNINFIEKSSIILPTGLAGIKNMNKEPDFNFYPNPTIGRITIQWNDVLSDIADISVTNITGQKVFNTLLELSGTNNAVLNLSELQAGMYFLNIETKNGNYNRKLVIQH